MTDTLWKQKNLKQLRLKIVDMVPATLFFGNIPENIPFKLIGLRFKCYSGVNLSSLNKLLRDQQELLKLNLKIDGQPIERELLYTILHLEKLKQFKLGLKDVDAPDHQLICHNSKMETFYLFLNTESNMGWNGAALDQFVNLFSSVQNLTLDLRDLYVAYFEGIGTDKVELKELTRLNRVKLKICNQDQILCGFKLPKLTSLRSGECSLSKWMQFCENNPNVHDLKLSCNRNINEIFPFLAQQLKKLQTLYIDSLFSEGFISRDTLINILSHCDNLKKLEIDELKGVAEDYADVFQEFENKLANLETVFTYEHVRNRPVS